MAVNDDIFNDNKHYVMLCNVFDVIVEKNKDIIKNMTRKCNLCHNMQRP